MNLHVHLAHRQRKSLGCEHNKRVEKRWRITCADIRPGVYGPLHSTYCIRIAQTRGKTGFVALQ